MAAISVLYIARGESAGKEFSVLERTKIKEWMIRALPAPRGKSGGVDVQNCIADVIVLSAERGHREEDLELLWTLRCELKKQFIVVVGDFESVEDKVHVLELADDYLGKPFEPLELAARLISIVRRERGEVRPELVFGRLSFNPDRREFRVDGKEVQFHPRHLKALELLFLAEGKPVPRRVIVQHVFPKRLKTEDNAISIWFSFINQTLKPLLGGKKYIQRVSIGEGEEREAAYMLVHPQ